MEILNLGPIKFFLKIEISRNRKERSITLSQKGYTQKILDKFAPNAKKSSNLYQIGYRLEPNLEKATPEDIY
jgi:hypothetical protein